MSSLLITAVQAVPRDPNMRRVKIGRRTVATLRAVDVDALTLRVGQKWTPSLAQRVEKAQAVQVVRQAALHALGRRMHSAAELRDKLSAKSHDSRMIDEVIGELARHGWLDDTVYGAELSSKMTRQRPAAAALLRARLQDRGVAKETARIVSLRHGASEADAVRFALRQREKLAAFPAPKAARRLAGLLSRRGFDDETVERAIRACGFNVDD